MSECELYGGLFVPCRISVLLGRKREKAPRKNPPNVTFSCFRMATFRPATQKYATFHALRSRLLFVVFIVTLFVQQGICFNFYHNTVIKYYLLLLHKHCFINFAFIFCPWKLCILRDHEIRKVTQALISLKLYCIFELKKNVFTYIHLPPYGISFYLRNVLYSKK